MAPDLSIVQVRPSCVPNVRREMRSFLAAALLTALPSVGLAADLPASSPASLYVLSTQDAAAEDGKSLTMTVRETKRTPDFSIVDVEYVSGGSASSLFLLRGLCGVMLARGQKVAVAEQVSESPVEFRMTFPSSAKVEEARGAPRVVLSESDCTRLRPRHE